MQDLTIIREQLVTACRRAYSRGIQTGSGGNVSARVLGEELMLVKASGSSFGDSFPSGFLITDFDGRLVEGEGKPTREALLHGYLYSICPWIGAVVHVHAPWSIGWASTGKALPLTTWHSELKLKAEIPTLDIKAPIVPAEDFPLVGALYDECPRLPAFLLKDHGIVAVGADVINAEHTAELIEETAQIVYLKGIASKLRL